LLQSHEIRHVNRFERLSRSATWFDEGDAAIAFSRAIIDLARNKTEKVV
jgi:hypothetical protein